MSDPIILIGTRKDSGSLGAVGLYASADEAMFAVHSGKLPSDCCYSVMSPKMGETITTPWTPTGSYKHKKETGGLGFYRGFGK